MMTKLKLLVVAFLKAALLEPTSATDGKSDECGIASVYATVSEETASGEDTQAKDLTAAHRTLPFGILVQVDNQENGRSVVVRVPDRGPFISGRIIDLSQMASRELGISDLAKVFLKIVSIPKN